MFTLGDFFTIYTVHLVMCPQEILKIAGPIFLGQLIRYFVEDSPISTGDAYLYATGLILCSLMSSMFNAPFTFMSQVYGMRIRVACTGLVYRKVSALRSSVVVNPKRLCSVSLNDLFVIKLSALLFFNYTFYISVS